MLFSSLIPRGQTPQTNVQKLFFILAYARVLAYTSVCTTYYGT